MDVRGDAPFPPRLIHHRVFRAAIRGYWAPRAHPAWTRATSDAAATLPRFVPPRASLILAAPSRRTPPAHPGGAGGRLPSREGCGVPSPLFVGAGGETWSCATTCRIFIFPFAKVAPQVAHFASSAEAGAPAAATSSQLPTPPPPPSLCPAPTSCPRAGAKNSRIPLRAWGVAGTEPLPGPRRRAPGGPHAAEPSRPALHALDRRLRSPARPRRRAPACAPVPPRLSASGRRGPPSLAGGIGGRTSRMRCQPPRPAGRGAGNWSLSPALAPLPARPPPPPGGKLALTLAETPGGLRTPRGAAWGAQGPRRHLRAPRVKRAGRKPRKVLAPACAALANRASVPPVLFFFFPSFFLLALICARH